MTSVRSGRPIDRLTKAGRREPGGPRRKKKPTGRPPGRPPLSRGEPTEMIITRVPRSLRRKIAVRRRELGMSESEYMRRLAENAALGVSSDALDDD